MGKDLCVIKAAKLLRFKTTTFFGKTTTFFGKTTTFLAKTTTFLK